MAKSWFDLHEQIASKFTAMNLPWDQLSQTASWASAVGFEQAAETADRTCRATVRSWAIASLRSVVDRCNTDPIVKNMAQDWQLIEHQATQLG